MKRQIQPTEEQKITLNLKDGPAWRDHCEHGDEKRVCTFEVFHPETIETRVIDFYIDDDYDTLCLRFGDEDGQMTAPISIANMREMADNPNPDIRTETYRAALAIVDAFGIPEVGSKSDEVPF